LQVVNQSIAHPFPRGPTFYQRNIKTAGQLGEVGMLAQEGLGSPDQASLLGDPNRQKPASIPATGATGFHLYENQHISFVGNQIQLAPRAAPPLGQDLPALLTEILPHPALADVACILEGSPSGQGIHKKITSARL
jgi:hypothetical protein